MKKIEVTPEEMLEALNRSGYLLESEIARFLSSSGYFTESNQVIIDPTTGKSREIDLLAEYYDFHSDASESKIATSIKYVIEIKNNTFPLTLLTKFESSPNIELFDGIKQIFTIPEGLRTDKFEGYYEKLLRDDDGPLYTQYCSFQRKKEKSEELMALHPENIHSGLMKITQYCEEQVEQWNNRYKDEYFRNFVFQPILLINDDLFELEIANDNEHKIKQVDYSKLLFNYHYEYEPRIAIIYVVTKKGFPVLMNKLGRIEKEVLEEMKEIK